MKKISSFKLAVLSVILGLFSLSRVSKFREELPEERPQRGILNDEGLQRLAVKDYQGALKAFKASARLCEPRPTHCSSIFYNLAETYRELGEIDNAIMSYERALDLRRSTSVSKDNSLGPIYSGLGRTYLAAGKIQKARSYFDQSVADARAVGYRGSIADALNEMGRLELDWGNPAAALRVSEESLALLRSEPAPRLDMVLAAERLLGEANSRLGRIAEAEQHFRTCDLLAKQIGDEGAVYRSRINLAATLLERGALDEAEALCQGAVADTGKRVEAGFQADYLAAQSVLLEIHNRRGRSEEALALAKAAQLSTMVDSSMGTAVKNQFQVRVGNAYLNARQYADAEVIADRLLEIPRTEHANARAIRANAIILKVVAAHLSGKPFEDIELLKEAEAELPELFGPSNRVSVDIPYFLGSALEKSDPSAALAAYRRSVVASKRVGDGFSFTKAHAETAVRRLCGKHPSKCQTSAP